ncbi:hypothetical protein Gpo141_00013782, partial [Globisporangium polare]
MKDSTTTQSVSEFGQSPLEGLRQVSGLNDDSFSDRASVCVLLRTSTSGYRVITRIEDTITPDAEATYSHTCATIALTMDAILHRCTLMGYNVTGDKLRIVDSLDGSNTYLIGNSLPILVMPYWDNCYTARFVVPGWDGSACVLRLVGEYTDASSIDPLAVVVNRAGREAKTIEWLKRPGGKWRNGWYEDLEGMKWYSDVTSTEKDGSGVDIS